MIKHVVMFKLQDFALDSSKDENLLKMKNMLEALPAIIPEIKYYEIGVNTAHGETAWDAVLISKFDSIENMNEYKEHPKHRDALDFILKICDELAVVDYVLS